MKNMINRHFLLLSLLAFATSPLYAAKISGELKKWHKVTLTFDGPQSSETAEPNPFLDYRLNVIFRHDKSGTSYTVPGYFAADGDAAETSADSGDQWRVHFCPDREGTWTYKVSFRKGQNIAVDDNDTAGESGGFMDGQTGSFVIGPTDKTGRDFRGKGMLRYVGKHHLQFAETGEYFLKCGPDAPETFLAYEDFDGTMATKKDVPLKTWRPHLGDWKTGDPTWKDGRGKGIIGALNYLADKGVNAVSFLTYNAGGDGDNVWPFRDRDEKVRYDCSKLDQWQIVLEHAQHKSLYLHFKTQETEMDDNRSGDRDTPVRESLDSGRVGPERKLYYRELIARFGYNPALNWNLGEENTQTTKEQKEMAAYFNRHDPYKHNIVLHTFPDWQEKVYTPLLGSQSELTGVSLQNDWQQTHELTKYWIKASAEAGKPWVVANDEQGHASRGAVPDTGYQGFDPKTTGYSMHDIRRQVLWGNLMAGGAGVEYYFGYSLPENDLLCQDWRSRDKSWDYGRIAIDFFHDHNIPFWEMSSADDLISNETGWCLAKPGQVYVVYIKNGGTAQLDLGDSKDTYTIQWYNPRTGGPLQKGNVSEIDGPGRKSIGQPLSECQADWAVLIQKTP